MSAETLVAQLPKGRLVVRRLEWGELLLDAAPAEFVTSGPMLWNILGFPARWPEFTIRAPEGFSLVGGLLTVNATNRVARYTVIRYLPEVDGYWLERLP